MPLLTNQKEHKIKVLWHPDESCGDSLVAAGLLASPGGLGRGYGGQHARVTLQWSQTIEYLPTYKEKQLLLIF